MVLGIRLTAVALAVFSATAALAEQLDTATFGGPTATLSAAGSMCLLEVNGDAYDTGLPAPCSFLRRGKDKAPTVQDYGEAGQVILIAGPPAHPDDYTPDYGLSPEDLCSHMARGAILRNGGVTLTEVYISPLGYCRDIAPDEKFYYGLAYPD